MNTKKSTEQKKPFSNLSDFRCEVYAVNDIKWGGLGTIKLCKRWPFVTQDGGSVDTPYHKLGVNDFKCEIYAVNDISEAGSVQI